MKSKGGLMMHKRNAFLVLIILTLLLSLFTTTGTSTFAAAGDPGKIEAESYAAMAEFRRKQARKAD